MAIETDLEAGTERRRFCRRSISEFQMLTADVLPAGTARQQRCIVLNVSECGLGVQPFLRLFPGHLVELRFGVPGVEKPFTGRGMVAWTGSGGPAGIQFIDMASWIRERLRKWVGEDIGLTPPQPSASDAYLAGQGAQELESALHLIAKRAQVVTRANGAAIALGDSESMVCRASTGVAPNVGVSLRSGFGLAGQCICTGRIAQSPDARSDARIDATVTRQLQLGSAVIVPICAAEKINGVLGVFSRHPRAFDDFHIRRLERLAAVIASAMQISPGERPGGELKSGSGVSSARSGEFRLASLLGMRLPASDGRPLNRLESLWNQIETAHRRKDSSDPVQ
jgi:putative methionine-R-sulfoxide reductase with GAF domain